MQIFSPFPVTFLPDSNTFIRSRLSAAASLSPSFVVLLPPRLFDELSAAAATAASGAAALFA